MTAAELGFDRPTANSIDAVSDRDFALDYLAAAAICAVHLSRLAEELVLWSTPQFGFVRMPEAFTSGSSIMPQKRNPDAAELVRGKSGRILGTCRRCWWCSRACRSPIPRTCRRTRKACSTPPTPSSCASPPARRCWTASRSTPAADARGGRRRLHHRHRPRRLAGARQGRAVPRGAWHRRRASVKLAEEQGLRAGGADRWRSCRRSTRGSTRARWRCWASTSSVASRRSFGGTAPERVLEAVAAAEERLSSSHGLR